MTTLKPLRRRAAAVSAPLLLALSLTACGGGADGAPEDASVEEFCAVQNDVPDDIDEDDAGAVLDAVKQNAEDLAEVGTPADFSADAREGFVLYLDYIDGADESDVESDENPEDVFGDDADKITAFFTEAAEACAGDLGEDLEGQLDDLEGQLPSDSPS